MSHPQGTIVPVDLRRLALRIETLTGLAPGAPGNAEIINEILVDLRVTGKALVLALDGTWHEIPATDVAPLEVES